MNDNLYSAKKYRDLVKKIKSKIRSYENGEIINSCINYLYAPTENQIDQSRKQPWLVLLLMKWTLTEEYRVITHKYFLTRERFNSLLQLMHDLGALVRMPNQYSHHILFFRNIAYQQFFYQRDFSLSHLARQTLLFSKLPKTHSFHKTFLDITKVDIQSFLEISLCLLTRFMDFKESNVTVSWFSPLYDEYGENKINNFLLSISTNREKLGGVLKRLNRAKDSYNEFYEQTPFLNTPLIKSGDKYFCVYPNVLYRTLEHFIYDTLRKWNPSGFMDKFGSIFENYVKSSLNQANLTFYDETFLREKIKGSSKIVDFLITGENTNIFIDAKAVEMSYLGKITHLSDIIKDKTKDTAIKAIEQAIAVNSILLENKIVPEIPFQSQNFLLVVTFKELYLGNGQYFYDAIAKEKIDEIYSNYPEKAHIKLSNMYFITIEELDSLIALIKSGEFSLESTLEKAVKNDSDPRTHKFDFTLHLRSMNENILIPDFINSEFDIMFKKLEKILSHKNN